MGGRSPPGSKKSPAMKQACNFIERHQREQFKLYQESLKKNEQRIYTIDCEIAQFQNQIQNSIRKNDESLIISFEDKITHLKEIRSQLLPNVKRFIVNSITIEKLIDLFSQHKDGLLLVRDELSALLDLFHKKGHENDRQFFMEGWSGDNSFAHDTISRGTNFVENLCLGILGTTQPSVIKKLLEQTINENKDDGFIQRFQMAIYPNESQEPKFVDITYDDKNDYPVERLFNSLINLKSDNSKAVQLDDEAYQLYKHYFNDLENEIYNQKIDVFKSHLAKYNKLTPALSLIFHVIEELHKGLDISPLVRKESMERAILWTNFLKSHARKIYNLDYSYQAVSAFELASKIADGKVVDGMSIRDVYKHQWKDLKNQNEVELAAQFLESHGWIDLEEMKSGGRPSLKLKFHPELLEFIKNNEWRQ